MEVIFGRSTRANGNVFMMAVKAVHVPRFYCTSSLSWLVGNYNAYIKHTLYFISPWRRRLKSDRDYVEIKSKHHSFSFFTVFRVSTIEIRF